MLFHIWNILFRREKRTDAPRNGGTFPWVGAGNPDRIEIPESVRTSGSILRGQDEETERILAQFAEYPMQTVLMTAGKRGEGFR